MNTCSEFLVRKNIEVLQRYRGKRVSTTCPHCFNALKNEYPRLGAALRCAIIRNTF